MIEMSRMKLFNFYLKKSYEYFKLAYETGNKAYSEYSLILLQKANGV